MQNDVKVKKYSVGLSESLEQAVKKLVVKYEVSTASAIRMLMIEGYESLREQGRI